MSDSGDVKPDVKPAANVAPAITICVKDQTGEKTFFKIKRTTLMGKVLDTYAQRKGVTVAALRFLHDGQRIGPSVTPDDLDMEDEDLIEVFLEQQGGASRVATELEDMELHRAAALSRVYDKL